MVLNSQKDGDIEKFMTQNQKNNKNHRFQSTKSRSFTPQVAGKFQEESDIISAAFRSYSVFCY